MVTLSGRQRLIRTKVKMLEKRISCFLAIQKTPKHGKKRTANASDDSGDSSSSDIKKCKYENLPPWVKPLLKDKVMPTVCEYFGIQDNPWSLNTNQYTFIQLLQKVIDYVFPYKHYHLLKSDLIYKWV